MPAIGIMSEGLIHRRGETSQQREESIACSSGFSCPVPGCDGHLFAAFAHNPVPPVGSGLLYQKFQRVVWLVNQP